jgi:hypothetical protein
MLKDNLTKIADILQQEIVLQLNIPRQSKGYYGEPKRGVSAPIASGNLVNNVKVEWIGDEKTDTLELVVKMPDYWYWVNYGRKPGRWPPVAPIDKWVVQKQGFRNVIRDQSGRFIPRKSLVFLIRRSIGLYGYEGTEFLQNAYANTAAIIREEIGDNIADWFLGLFDDIGE